jgi:hypothetical protein
MKTKRVTCAYNLSPDPARLVAVNVFDDGFAEARAGARAFEREELAGFLEATFGPCTGALTEQGEYWVARIAPRCDFQAGSPEHCPAAAARLLTLQEPAGIRRARFCDAHARLYRRRASRGTRTLTILADVKIEEVQP